MFVRSIRILIVLTLIGTFVSVSNAQKAPFGWDLTYKTSLQKNAASDVKWISKWLEQSRSPVDGWLKEWREKHIDSAILIEFPAFHAAERTSILVVKTPDHVYYREMVERTNATVKDLSLPVTTYDQLYTSVASWKQRNVRAVPELGDEAIPGYMGVVSTFSGTESGQILLTLDDFVICIDPKKGCEPGGGRLKTGRVLVALDPIFKLQGQY